MVFSDAAFFAFFAAYFLLHLLVPPRFRIYLIIVGSTVFYAWWRISYVWLPFLLTLIAWVGVRWFNSAPNAASRRRRCALTIILLFSFLAGFKYSRFFAQDVLGEIGIRRKNQHDHPAALDRPIDLTGIIHARLHVPRRHPATNPRRFK